MVQFDRTRMNEHVARQEQGYATHDAFAIKNSTLVQHSRIHKELFLLTTIMEQALALGAVRRLLEVGCGIGALTGALRSIANQVVAFDLSPAGVATARRRYEGWPGITLAVADGTDPEACPEAASGDFDIILIREFHPFTRDFYADRPEADRIHGETLGAYARLLAPAGAIVISHAETKPQVIRPESLALPDGIEIVISGVDPRLVAAFLFFTRNNLDRAVGLARLASPLARWLGLRNVLYVLKKHGGRPV